MIYDSAKDLLLDLLRCPKDPPAAPRGTHGAVHVLRASPAWLQYRLLGVLIGFSIVALMALIGDVMLLVFLGPVGILIGLFVIVAVLAKGAILYTLTRLDYEMRYYIVTDRSLRIREGVWQIRELTLTFDNVQNVKINQGPLQRLFGIYDLQVETAGGGGAVTNQPQGNWSGVAHRGTLRGIKQPERLRDLIMTYLRQAHSAGLGDVDDESNEASAARPALGPPELDVLRAIARETAEWRRELESPATA